jgi:hypothetical protein
MFGVLHLFKFLMLAVTNRKLEQPQSTGTYINRVEIGEVYLPSQLERKPQLCT